MIFLDIPPGGVRGAHLLYLRGATQPLASYTAAQEGTRLQTSHVLQREKDWWSSLRTVAAATASSSSTSQPSMSSARTAIAAPRECGGWEKEVRTVRPCSVALWQWGLGNLGVLPGTVTQ